MVDEEMMAVSVEPPVEPPVEQPAEPVAGPPAELAAEEPATPRPEKLKRKGKGQVEWRQEADLEDVTHLFMACARCSYFLAGYQLIFDDLASAVSQSNDNWLTLSWNKPVRLLLQKSFGCLIDVDLLHYAGHCLECQRVFVYEFLEEPPAKATLRIELRPR
jgi:hypothetical protein